MLAPPPPAGEAPRRSWLERGSNFVYRPIERLYTSVLAFCLRRRWVVGLAIIGSCATMVPMAKQVGGDFLPPNDEAQFEVYLQTPEGTTLEATTIIAERLARKIRRYAEVDSTLVTVADSDQRQSNVGRIYARLTDPEQRARSQAEVMELVRQEVLPDVPAGTRVAAQQVNDFSMGGQNAIVSYVISGPDLDKLEHYGKKVLAEMKQVPGVVDLDSSLVDPVEETTITPDLDRAATLGVDPQDITNTLAVLVGGLDASTFEDRGDQYPVFLRAAERYRNDTWGLTLIAVPSRTLGQVPLFDVIKVGAGIATSKITRQSRERAVTITMNVSPGFSESAIVQTMQDTIKRLDMPAGYTAEPFGRSKEMAKMQGAFMFAILLAIVFMYLVLAAQFESWLYPFIIILSLPLTLPFAIISLLITGGSLNIFYAQYGLRRHTTTQRMPREHFEADEKPTPRSPCRATCASPVRAGVRHADGRRPVVGHRAGNVATRHESPPRSSVASRAHLHRSCPARTLRSTCSSAARAPRRARCRVAIDLAAPRRRRSIG